MIGLWAGFFISTGVFMGLRRTEGKIRAYTFVVSHPSHGTAPCEGWGTLGWRWSWIHGSNRFRVPHPCVARVGDHK